VLGACWHRPFWGKVQQLMNTIRKWIGKCTENEENQHRGRRKFKERMKEADQRKKLLDFGLAAHRKLECGQT
jgi:hypothetical protein